MQKPSLPKGTRDFGPEQVIKRKYILNTIEEVFKKYAFKPLETPAMENLSTLSGKYGDEGDQLLFKILNSGDYLKDLEGSKLAEQNSKTLTSFIAEKGLRYDLTVPFARYVVMNRNDITFPFKRYQMQPVWRADKPQKGRYREFWQCDADVVGSNSLLHEVDLLMIYTEALNKLGIEHQVLLNNRKVLEGIIALIGAEAQLQGILVAIDKFDKIGWEGVSAELLKILPEQAVEVLKNIFSRQGDNQSLLQFLEEKLQTETGKKGIAELEFILNTLNILGVAGVQVDLTLARGLNYYTGAIVEVKAKNISMGSIGGGGRYDNLTGIFGLPGVSGVGISFGLDRIYDVMEELKLFPTNLQESGTRILLCCFDEPALQYAVPLLKQLRDAGIIAELYPEAAKMKKQLGYADAHKIPFTAIIGDNEIQSGKLAFKNMLSGEQQLLSIHEIIEHLNSTHA